MNFYNIFIFPFLVIGSIFMIFTTGPIEWASSSRCLAKFDLLFPILKSLRVFFVSLVKLSSSLS